MQKNLLTIALTMFSFFSNAQKSLDTSFAKANADMRIKNLYQKIVWGMSPLHEYLFDQTEGTVKYFVSDNIEAHAIPKVLGTYNLDDETFFWADKNPSIRSPLSDKTADFRAQLPQKYREDKFKSDTDFNNSLLALFSNNLHAVGFDSKRQDNTIIYYALMEVAVFEDEKKTKTIAPKDQVTLIKNDSLVDILKEFHRKAVEINRQFNAQEITSDDAFKRIKEVHREYWLNEDDYFSPSLSWPCAFDEKKIISWQVFKMAAENRLFVAYTTDLSWTIEIYAYEIDINAVGKKMMGTKKLIISEF